MHIHVRATKYEVCNFDDYAQELNAHVSAFRIGIMQYKYDDRCHANNLNYQFFIMQNIEEQRTQ